MSNWSDGYVNSNGIKIHYYRTGGDKPKVVFNLRGTTCESVVNTVVVNSPP
jgi:hypothetical protein